MYHDHGCSQTRPRLWDHACAHFLPRSRTVQPSVGLVMSIASEVCAINLWPLKMLRCWGNPEICNNGVNNHLISILIFKFCFIGLSNLDGTVDGFIDVIIAIQHTYCAWFVGMHVMCIHCNCLNISFHTYRSHRQLIIMIGISKHTVIKCVKFPYAAMTLQHFVECLLLTP